MGGQSGVQIRMSAIEAAWRELGGSDVWIYLRTSDGTFEDFAEASADVDEPEGRIPDSGAWSELPSPAPGGFAILLAHCDTLEITRKWVRDFATQLERRGFSGSLTRAPGVKDRPFLGSMRGWVPTAFVAYTPDMAAVIAARARDAHWYAPLELTQRICSMADRWARMPGGELVLRQNVYETAVELEDTSEPLSRALLTTGMGGLQSIDDQRERATSVSFCPQSIGIYQYIDDRAGWSAAVDRLREVLTALPRETNYACVRPSVRLALGIDTIDNPQPLAFVPEHEVRYRQDLLTRFVPDACGIQVLTAEHLERVPDQSAWKVTELSHNRYLVEHRDLSAWYANTLPGEEVLTAARADFAPILLTREVSRANPAPW